jgi:hypothetical protein
MVAWITVSVRLGVFEHPRAPKINQAVMRNWARSVKVCVQVRVGCNRVMGSVKCWTMVAYPDMNVGQQKN